MKDYHYMQKLMPIKMTLTLKRAYFFLILSLASSTFLENKWQKPQSEELIRNDLQTPYDTVFALLEEERTTTIWSIFCALLGAQIRPPTFILVSEK